MAAMNFGPNTEVLSNDTFRDHLNKLPDSDHKKLFMKWQYHRIIRHNTENSQWRIKNQKKLVTKSKWEKDLFVSYCASNIQRNNVKTANLK